MGARRGLWLAWVIPVRLLWEVWVLRSPTRRFDRSVEVHAGAAGCWLESVEQRLPILDQLLAFGSIFAFTDCLRERIEADRSHDDLRSDGIKIT